MSKFGTIQNTLNIQSRTLYSCGICLLIFVCYWTVLHLKFITEKIILKFWEWFKQLISMGKKIIKKYWNTANTGS